MSRLVRINRYLASAGLGSRRKCEELIRRGEVQVNGECVASLSLEIDPERDTVTVGRREVMRPEKTVLLVLNKPAGILSTASDTHGRKTVIDLARESGYTERLFPVGRLDLDTSGILLITNDGELAFRLTHPRYKVEKTYEAVVEGAVSKRTIDAIASGMRAGDFVTRPCTLRILGRYADKTKLEIRLKEGRKRQIRRMFQLFGHRVISLHRTAIGDLVFDDLDTGELRPLTSEEERRLRECSGLA
jgi:23S rRNA pseudouridine2605 synthase